MVEHSPDYRPLSGVPEPRRTYGISRSRTGCFTEDGDEPIARRRSRRREIEASGYDYIALGHIHVFSDVSQGATRAFYCGTPAPLYASENAGWVALVDCVPGEPVAIERVTVLPRASAS